jgi:hypothetical protein
MRIAELTEPMEAATTYSGPLWFFRKHLNGDYSLARSYWVHTVPIHLFTHFLASLLLPWLGKNFPARYSSAGFLLLTVFGILAWVWAISGTWASANKHVSRGGKQIWANAAKAMIVIGILRVTAEMGGMSGVLVEHWKVATGRQIGPEVSFQVRADGKSLLLAGGINDGTAEALSKALDLAPSVTTVVLQSTGGWVRQGNMIAKVISERGLNTYVEHECSSACTIAFLAGKDRSAEPYARIGFHSFVAVGAEGSSPNATYAAAVEETYRRAGLSPAFITRVISTPPNKMWHPSHDELLAEHVFTRMSLGGETARLATLIDTREKLAEELVKLPAFGALVAKYPTEFNQIIDTVWVRVQARRPDSEVMTVAHEHFSQLTARLLPITSDSALLNYNLNMAAQSEALAKR